MNKQEFTLDRFTRRILVVLTFLLAVVAYELWVAMPGRMSAVQAQIPDTGLQRQQIVEEAQKTNQLLEEIRDHLRTGTVKVRMESADKRGGEKNKTGRP